MILQNMDSMESIRSYNPFISVLKKIRDDRDEVLDNRLFMQLVITLHRLEVCLFVFFKSKIPFDKHVIESGGVGGVVLPNLRSMFYASEEVKKILDTHFRVVQSIVDEF